MMPSPVSNDLEHLECTARDGSLLIDGGATCSTLAAVFGHRVTSKIL